jgi:hypothetical protein
MPDIKKRPRGICRGRSFGHEFRRAAYTNCRPRGKVKRPFF